MASPDSEESKFSNSDVAELEAVIKEGGVVIKREWCGTLKTAVWYFDESGVVL